MTLNRTPGVGVLLGLLATAACAHAADLSVTGLSIQGGTTGELVVSGGIEGESTFGVNVLVQIVPRANARGVVRFTPAPPVDIVQLNDPWPGVGTFTTYDTDITESDTLNGAVADDGVFVPATVTFSGDLASFPVTASVDASGVWDVVLATSVGDSGWEGVPTTLGTGIITATPSTEVPTVSAWGLAVSMLFLLTVGTILISRCSTAPVRNA